MKKKRILYLILFVVFSYIGLIFFEVQSEKLAIKKFGSIRAVTITDRPNCGSSTNSMEVSLDNKLYQVEIGKNKCIQGFYKIGDKVEVMHNPSFNRLILPDEKVKLGYTFSIVFFLLPLYFLIKLIILSRRK